MWKIIEEKGEKRDEKGDEKGWEQKTFFRFLLFLFSSLFFSFSPHLT
jgi:hypothetical protein